MTETGPMESALALTAIIGFVIICLAALIFGINVLGPTFTAMIDTLTERPWEAAKEEAWKEIKQ